MTGQQKSGTNKYSTGSPHTQQKGKEKGITHTKNRFQKPPKRTKIFKKKDYIHTKTTFMDKERCQRKQMTCQNPFKREKDTEERRKTIKNPFQAL